MINYDIDMCTRKITHFYQSFVDKVGMSAPECSDVFSYFACGLYEMLILAD